MHRTSSTLLVLAALVAGCLEHDLAKLDTSSSSTSSTTTSASSTPPAASPSTDTDVHTVTADGVGTTEASTTGQTESTADTTTATLTTEASTTATPAICGDSIVEGDEECDDPTDLDELACMTTCVRPRLAFLTSERFFPTDLHDLDGADNRCRKAALSANLPGPENFKAILSDSITSASERLHHGRGPYRLVNGLQVARDWNALMNETLDNPLATTELGTQGYSGAWSGTGTDGTAVPGISHCKDWSSDSFNDFGSYGRPTAVDAEWLEISNKIINPTECETQLALYCLEQE